jgi:colanic acid/amylovoran biosynthesis glycosyltransferase
MSAAARRLIVVTSRYPFGSQEAYLNTELAELARYFERIVVIPVRPPVTPPRHTVPRGIEILSWPLLNAEVLRRAARIFAARPRATFRAFIEMLGSRDRGRAKNLVVAAKALALADWAVEHGFDHIHAYWLSTPATVAMLAATVSDLAWSSTAHRWDIYEENALDVKERSASFIRTISTRGTRDLSRRMPTLNGRLLQLRLGTVVPAVRIPSFSQIAEFHVVCPAAFVAGKGHADLLAALAQLRSRGVAVRCTLCGTGPLKRDLEATVARLGLDGVVEFAGFVPQHTLHEWYRAGRFAAVVLASRSAGERAMEGVPSALIEAMAFGLPVVATDSGSVGELLDDQCGRLVKPEDPNELANALLDVYLNPAAAQERARRAYQRVASQHDVSTQMRKLARALVRKG